MSCEPLWTLRSPGSSLLIIPFVRTKTHGPCLWNIPLENVRVTESTDIFKFGKSQAIACGTALSMMLSHRFSDHVVSCYRGFSASHTLLHTLWLHRLRHVDGGLFWLSCRTFGALNLQSNHLGVLCRTCTGVGWADGLVSQRAGTQFFFCLCTLLCIVCRKRGWGLWCWG